MSYSELSISKIKGLSIYISQTCKGKMIQQENSNIEKGEKGKYMNVQETESLVCDEIFEIKSSRDRES